MNSSNLSVVSVGTHTDKENPVHKRYRTGLRASISFRQFTVRNMNLRDKEGEEYGFCDLQAPWFPCKTKAPNAVVMPTSLPTPRCSSKESGSLSWVLQSSFTKQGCCHPRVVPRSQGLSGSSNNQPDAIQSQQKCPCTRVELRTALCTKNQVIKASSGVNGTTALSFSWLYSFIPGFSLPLPFKDSVYENYIKPSTFKDSKRDSSLPSSPNTSSTTLCWQHQLYLTVIHLVRDTRPAAKHGECLPHEELRGRPPSLLLGAGNKKEPPRGRHLRLHAARLANSTALPRARAARRGAPCRRFHALLRSRYLLPTQAKQHKSHSINRKDGAALGTVPPSGCRLPRIWTHG
ncbi:hypothetical protein Anapl_03158 [Anas platyrhynchos]|uniref:Uncharacterized protein n=1 Tax=Anas platyrhynchos TaxID=8839 RepID=R0K9Z6_ANAPL|nr:hypothetical protein Anapl_03158 [Anas platyrhynchos]